MTRTLFEGFLCDPRVYQACEEFWAQLVADLIAETGRTGQWHPWIPRHTPNGSPVERDGNPICDARCEQPSRAFRIMQHQATPDEIEIVAWLKHYEEGCDELPRDELVINLGLTDESVRLAELLLRAWMNPETTPADMRGAIAALLPKYEG